MQYQIISIYCVCDDCLRYLGCKDDPQAKMSDAEVLATALTAAYLFGGCIWRAQLFLQSHGYFPNMLSKGRLNRRLHAVSEDKLMLIFSLIGWIFRKKKRSRTFIVDSFPVRCCQNCRIPRCQIIRGKEYHGYSSTKGSYFYGIRVHMLVTEEGLPVQLIFAPGSRADIAVFREIDLDLPEGATIYADAAYTDYAFEDLLKTHGLHLIAARRGNPPTSGRSCLRAREET